jgi:hypothetical protein
MNSYLLTLVQGQTSQLQLVATDSNGNPLNLSGYFASGYMKHRFGDNKVLLNLNPQIDTSCISGIVNVTISGSQTASLPVIEGVYNIDVFNSSGYVLQVLRGYVDVLPSIFA